jgi:hypothetical protein
MAGRFGPVEGLFASVTPSPTKRVPATCCSIFFVVLHCAQLQLYPVKVCNRDLCAVPEDPHRMLRSDSVLILSASHESHALVPSYFVSLALSLQTSVSVTAIAWRFSYILVTLNV